MGKAKKKKHCRTQGGRGVDYCDLIMNRHIIIKSHYQFDKLRKSERNAENYDKKKLCRRFMSLWLFALPAIFDFWWRTLLDLKSGTNELIDMWHFSSLPVTLLFRPPTRCFQIGVVSLVTWHIFFLLIENVSWFISFDYLWGFWFGFVDDNN